jgi:RNA polymerase sigma-70 factor, ECF subfamily
VREPEPETIGRARSGDLGAFETLVRAYQADAWRFAYHLTGNRATADEVTQEAFVRAFRRMATFRGEAKFTSWLMRIVRNCAMDAHRRAAREAALAERSVSESVSTDPQQWSGVEDRLRIGQAIRELPDDLRAAFIVIEVLGFTYAEAAAILETKVGTLKSRMHRARARLIEALSEGAQADEM